MNQDSRAVRTTSWLVGFVLAVSAVGMAQAPQTVPQAAQQSPGPGCMGMMGDRQAMMAAMQAQQKKLDDLVAAMNAATGADKVNRVAAAVTELVAQHNMMHSCMMTGMMGGGMMRGRGATPAP